MRYINVLRQECTDFTFPVIHPDSKLILKTKMQMYRLLFMSVMPHKILRIKIKFIPRE